MGVKIIRENQCNGCGICVDCCPLDVLRIDKGKKLAFISYPGDCKECYLCEISCPEEAIEVSPEAVETPYLPY